MRGVTLTEIVILLSIILLVMGIGITGYSFMVEQSNRAECTNNLTQIQLAIEQYRQSHNRKNPKWLSELVREGFLTRDLIPNGIAVTEFKALPESDKLYSKKPNFSKLFLCPSDVSDGMHGGKPDIEGSSANQYRETDHHTKSDPKSRISDDLITPCSYLYELNGSECVWWDGYLYDNGSDMEATLDTDRNGEISWQEAKHYQLNDGDEFNGGKSYPKNRFPIVRCFWHIEDIDSQDDEDVLNMSEGGNIYWTTVKWEKTANKK